MKGDYPRFKASYAHEELVEHFLLSPAERTLVETWSVRESCPRIWTI
jgi:hypothetical protein